MPDPAEQLPRTPPAPPSPGPGSSPSSNGKLPMWVQLPERTSASSLASLPLGPGTPTSDAAVRATSGDALASKAAIVQLGYLQDAWLPYFASPTHGGIRKRGSTNSAHSLKATGWASPTPSFASLLPPASAASATTASPLLPPSQPPSATGGRRSLAIPSGSHSPHPALATSIPSAGGPERKDPVFNRGTFVRVQGVRRLVDGFLAAVGDPATVQIVNIGCGLDTMGLEYQASGCVDRWLDLDFPEVTGSKVRTLWTTPALRAQLGEGAALGRSGTALTTPHYSICPGDVRYAETTLASLQQGGFVVGAPTLFLLECVLVYMTPEDAERVLHHCRTWLGDAGVGGVVLFEHVHRPDPWGDMMRHNLQQRGIALDAMLDCPGHLARLQATGWQEAAALTMHDAYLHWIPEPEKQRIHDIEALDEVEEWECMSRHYGFLWASWAGPGKSDVLRAWARAPPA